MTEDHRNGLILVALSTLAWSTAGLFTRAITEDLFTTLVWRGAFGTAGLLVVLILRDGVSGLRGFARLGRPGWAFAAVSGMGIYAYIGALRMTSIAHVAIIYAAVPFMTAGLAWMMMGTRPSRDAILASTAAFLGAVLMVGLGHDGNLLGDALALLMTFGMALMMVIARRHPTIPTLPAGITSAVVSVAIALPFAGALPAPDQLWLLAGFGLVNSAFAFALFLTGSARVAPIEAALLGALEAPIAPVWVWLVYGETPTLPTILGGAVVLTAVFWHILRQYRQA